MWGGMLVLLLNSVFGYIVTGNLDSINETKVHCGLIRDEDLNKNLEKFWKLEEKEEPIVKNKERLICEEHYANTHFRTKEGKYVVSMPLKKEPSCLGNSKDIALKRLGSLWNRLARDDNYLNLYRECYTYCQMNSLAASVKLTYSASIVDRLTDFWLKVRDEIGVSSIKVMNPPIDTRSSLFVAKSESE
ncbi:uncharacterized protein TNCV_1211831 [Trichonephila clavipes]|nr:uncharacterized protein TNCV_1211831 [Trichonephila clavipes]